MSIVIQTDSSGVAASGSPLCTSPLQTVMAEGVLPRIDRRASPAEWFAIWTRSRHEGVVRQQLEGKGIETFLPTVTRWSHWKDRKKQVSWPLFPGYCFARIDRGASLAVLTCSGVVSIVSFEGQPAAIPAREINDIRTLVESELRFDPCPFIQTGDLAEVVSGPLRGISGRLVRKGAHARLVLAVGLIGQGVMVEVDAADVRPY